MGGSTAGESDNRKNGLHFGNTFGRFLPLVVGLFHHMLNPNPLQPLTPPPSGALIVI